MSAVSKCTLSLLSEPRLHMTAKEFISRFNAEVPANTDLLSCRTLELAMDAKYNMWQTL